MSAGEGGDVILLRTQAKDKERINEEHIERLQSTVERMLKESNQRLKTHFAEKKSLMEEKVINVLYCQETIRALWWTTGEFLWTRCNSLRLYSHCATTVGYTSIITYYISVTTECPTIVPFLDIAK